MNPPGPAAKADDLLRRLIDHDDESAAASLFLHLYRESPQLRHWLREDYARDATLRTKLDQCVAKGIPPGIVRFAELTDDHGSWREEQRRLKGQLPEPLYGGLTWREVVQLIHHYQAGAIDPGAFLLVRQWREVGRASPTLLWAGLAFLEAILPSGKRRLLKHLNQALAFVKKYENKAERRTAVGYSDWWKLNALFHIIRYPQESYSMRELRAHLATLDLHISARDLRRFCQRHGIKRDSQAGRPRRPLTARAGDSQLQRPEGSPRVSDAPTPPPPPIAAPPLPRSSWRAKRSLTGATR